MSSNSAAYVGFREINIIETLHMRFQASIVSILQYLAMNYSSMLRLSVTIHAM